MSKDPKLRKVIAVKYLPIAMTAAPWNGFYRMKWRDNACAHSTPSVKVDRLQQNVAPPKHQL